MTEVGSTADPAQLGARLAAIAGSVSNNRHSGIDPKIADSIAPRLSEIAIWIAACQVHFAAKFISRIAAERWQSKCLNPPHKAIGFYDDWLYATRLDSSMDKGAYVERYGSSSGLVAPSN